MKVVTLKREHAEARLKGILTHAAPQPTNEALVQALEILMHDIHRNHGGWDETYVVEEGGLG